MNPSEETSSIDLFVVVCTRFHNAHGVFSTPQQALEVAQELNDNPRTKDACEYIPVPLLINPDTTRVDKYNPKDRPMGQYL